MHILISWSEFCVLVAYFLFKFVLDLHRTWFSWYQNAGGCYGCFREGNSAHSVLCIFSQTPLENILLKGKGQPFN